MPTTKKKTPARKKTTRRRPAAMTGVQQDRLQSAQDRKLTSVTEKLKTGKIDHGPAASPDKGVLDPREFDKFEVEHRAPLTESQRIMKVICEVLDEEHSRGGKYQWVCGFFIPTDPRSSGSSGYKPLTPEMLGRGWSEQFQAEMGLTLFNGALCWNGRGTFERHVICVKTKQLQHRQLAATEAQMESMLKQPESVAGERVGRLEVKETSKKLPLVPVKQDGISNQQ